MFKIKLSPDLQKLYKEIETILKNNNVDFSSYENVYIQKTEGSIPTILAYVFNFKTGIILIGALKYISPLIIEYIKNRKSTLEVTFNEHTFKVESNTNLKQIKKFIEDMEESLKQENK